MQPTENHRQSVGIVLVNQEKKVFIGQRFFKNMNLSDDFWQMPQGGIDEGEDPETAAIRELCEEVGCCAESVSILAVSKNWYDYEIPKEYKAPYHAQTQKWFLVEFRGADDEINIDQPHPEFRNWEWSDYKKVKTLVIDFKKEVYKKVFKDFSWYFEDSDK